MQNEPTPAPSDPSGRGVFAFFALACAWTWILATPAALAFSRGEPPAPYAVAGAGLSAFGPMAAALLVAARRRELGGVFGRWRASPLWIALALFTPAAIHLAATALFTLFGGHSDAWIHPPLTPEHWAAFVVFPLGEELGWRGFAHARVVGRFGLVRGSLLLGAVWGLWHFAYSFPPGFGGFDAFTFGMTMIELPLYALLFAWLYERTGRALWVAIALHAGAHLDHLERAPRELVGLHATHLALAGLVAVLCARSLGKTSVSR